MQFALDKKQLKAIEVALNDILQYLPRLKYIRPFGMDCYAIWIFENVIQMVSGLCVDYWRTYHRKIRFLLIELSWN